VSQAPDKDERAAVRARASGALRRPRPTGPVALGVLSLVLLALYVPLTILTRDWSDAPQTALAFLVSLLGLVVLRHQRRNPIGWIAAALGAFLVFNKDAGRYAVLDYKLHHADLPFGAAATLLETTLWIAVLLIVPLLILLFPDGVLSRPWRIVLWTYLAQATVTVAAELALTAWWIAHHHFSVDWRGQIVQNVGPNGFLAVVSFVVVLAQPLFWASFVGRQVVAWRRASGERREQLKWLMAGSAITVVAIVGLFLSEQISGGLARALVAVCSIGAYAVAVCMCVAILKFHLYDIDRLVSRTLSYAGVTALVVGAYVALVTLSTRALRLDSSVAVAASTLGAAALFNPLRVRVQRAVDRRFNRARYDAAETVASFTTKLRESVDLGSVERDLLSAVERAFEPTQAVLWLRKRG
jgi:hypothetical protein